MEYTLTGLHPGRKYDVRVLPGSLDVAGQWFTKEMPRVTGDINPPVAASLDLVSTNSTSVVAVWQDSPDTQAKPPVGFKLTYQLQGARQPLLPPLVLAPSEKTSLTSGLGPNSVYEFHLSAIYADGTDGQASVRSIQTLPDSDALDESDSSAAYDEAPTQLQVQAVSWNAVQIGWQLPPVAADVVFYTVRCVQEADADFESHILPAASGKMASLLVFHGQLDSTLHSYSNDPFALQKSVATAASVRYIRTTANQAELNQLTAYTNYQLSVRYHDHSGRFSVFGAPVQVRTKAHLPSVPEDVSWTLQDGSIQLKWRPPLHPNGPVLAYVIHVSQDPHLNPELWARQEELGSRFRTQVFAVIQQCIRIHRYCVT